MCVHTVIEMADEDRVGLLHDTTTVVCQAGLDIKSLAVRTVVVRSRAMDSLHHVCSSGVDTAR